MSNLPKEWKLVPHSYQIADTGDYDGCYEITDGRVSILTKDDDDEALQPIVDALNDSGCKFYKDDFYEFENKILKDQLNEQQSTIQELCGVLDKIIQKVDNEPKWVIKEIAQQALQKHKQVI